MDRIDGGVHWGIVCVSDRGRLGRGGNQLAPLEQDQSAQMVNKSWILLLQFQV